MENAFVQRTGPEITVQLIQGLVTLDVVAGVLEISLLTAFLVHKILSGIVMDVAFVTRNGTLLRTVLFMVANVTQHAALA